MNDREIIANILGGKNNEFGELVSRYSGRIYRLCLSLCGNGFDAEDAAQEAFIDAFLYLSSLSEPEKFFPWLCSIARRKAYRLTASRRGNEEYGTKVYWFAPGVGIVKTQSRWSEDCYAECLLDTYSAPASDKSDFLPIQIGNSWEYEEPHLTAEGYRAKAIFRIASGMNGRYLMTNSQEFICFKTEDEYREFAKKSHIY